MEGLPGVPRPERVLPALASVEHDVDGVVSGVGGDLDAGDKVAVGEDEPVVNGTGPHFLRTPSTLEPGSINILLA